MRPITFACEAKLGGGSVEIAERILDTENWTDFDGYGPIPGIERAEFEIRTDGVVGSRVRVQNRDGSTHVEEIVEWDPKQRVVLHMQDLAPPLSRLVVRIVETWQFRSVDGATHVERSFALEPKSGWARPLVWMISRLLRRAIDRHLRQLAAERPPLTIPRH